MLPKSFPLNGYYAHILPEIVLKDPSGGSLAPISPADASLNMLDNDEFSTQSLIALITSGNVSATIEQGHNRYFNGISNGGNNSVTTLIQENTPTVKQIFAKLNEKFPSVGLSTINDLVQVMLGSLAVADVKRPASML
jgi:hypothetical protein